MLNISYEEKKQRPGACMQVNHFLSGRFSANTGSTPPFIVSATQCACACVKKRPSKIDHTNKIYLQKSLARNKNNRLVYLKKLHKLLPWENEKLMPK